MKLKERFSRLKIKARRRQTNGIIKECDDFVALYQRRTGCSKKEAMQAFVEHVFNDYKERVKNGM